MSLRGIILRRIVGGGLGSRSVECRKSFMRLTSTLTSPKLFISGVSPSTSDENIRQAFAPFGNLREAKVIKDRGSGRSMGFAIVTYDTIQEADKARERMQYTRFGNFLLLIESESEFFKQEWEYPKSGCSLYLDLDDFDESQDLTTDDKLRDAFSPFGKVLEATIRKGGNSKGRAVVRYGTKEEAEKAQDALNDNLLGQKPSEYEKTHSDTSYITSRTSGYTQITHYHTEGGKHEVKKQIIRKGDIISLKDILFTRNRDYLVKNNKEHVKAEHLEDKVIVIYFLPLYLDYPQHSEYHTALLKEVYYDLPNSTFEVVLVANHHRHSGFKGQISGQARDPEKHFEDLFSSMPWTAIPYSDAETRRSMERDFGCGVYKEHPPLTMFFVDPTGMVLQCDHGDVFLDFGASGYPFSDKRLEFMLAEDDAAAKQPSLRTLLATPERDYVISNKGDKVSIDILEDKVVALYFYHADNANHYLTETLMLAKNHYKFEVVLLYITEPGLYNYRNYGEESFWKEFKTMPWLALPFRDESCKKLRRVFKFSNNDAEGHDNLVIIGPHGEFIEPFGANILLEYGISAYPFTFSKAVELETEKIKQLKLEKLWDKNTVFRRNNGSQVSFSELSGKRVMLVLEMIGGMKGVFCESSPNAYFLIMLKGRYLLTKGTDDEFEVIRILADNLEFSTSQHLIDKVRLASHERDLGDDNWISCLGSEMLENICSSDYWYGSSIDDLDVFLPILAFDRDGTLVRKTIVPTFEDIKFPFYPGGLEKEMLTQLTNLLI